MLTIDNEPGGYSGFGKHLRKYREHLGKTTEEVAHELGMSKGGYYKYESENFLNFSQENLRKLCHILQMDYTETVMRLTIEKFGILESTKNPLDEAKGKLVYGVMTTLQELTTKGVDSSEMLISRFHAKTTELLSKDISFDMAGLVHWIEGLDGENNFWIGITDAEWFHADGGFSEALYKQLENRSKCTIFLPAGQEKNVEFNLYRLNIKYPSVKDKIYIVPLSGSDHSMLMRGQNHIIVNPTSFTQERFALNCVTNTGDFSKNVIHLIKNPREDIHDFVTIIKGLIDQETWDIITSSGGNFKDV